MNNEQGERPVRKERPEQGERPVRRERPDQGERPVRRERPEQGERPVRRERPEQGERPVRKERPEDDWESWARDREQRVREKKEKELKKKKRRLIIKAFVLPLSILLLLFVMGTLAVNGYMLLVERRNILSVKEWADHETEQRTDCILVLGCSVIGNQEPSNDLKGRLEMTIELYNASPHKIIVSGDHSADGYYNEVGVMKNYLVDRGIPSSDIFVDHYGYSTYDSIYRAYYCFNVRKVTIVTQQFHLYRAVFLARAIGMETVGVASNGDSEDKISAWNMREVLARDKDFLASVFWPKAEKMGDNYSLSGDGDETDER